MMITGATKAAIPFRPGDARKLGQGCFYLDLIIWLNGERIELGDRVGFNYGCYVNGFGGLVIGSDTIFGPYTMIHTANHRMEDPSRPIHEQGWEAEPVEIGGGCWIGMGVSILPGVRIGDGCVIGAGSVVSTDIDPRSVVVGNPARIIRSR
jgi:acetyltransferase-like isoleucine patch superfamily enzyme